MGWVARRGPLGEDRRTRAEGRRANGEGPTGEIQNARLPVGFVMLFCFALRSLIVSFQRRMEAQGRGGEGQLRKARPSLFVPLPLFVCVAPPRKAGDHVLPALFRFCSLLVALGSAPQGGEGMGRGAKGEVGKDNFEGQRFPVNFLLCCAKTAGRACVVKGVFQWPTLSEGLPRRSPTKVLSGPCAA